MVERISPAGITRVIIDTGPDFREQMIDAHVDAIDAVIYTHPHADHIHGIDDLRGFALAARRLIDIHADHPTLSRLYESFGYCFSTPPGSSYPPILRAHEIDHAAPVVISGQGGTIRFEPLRQVHGDIISLGYRIGPVAYCSDVSDYPPETVARLAGLELLVVDALQYRRHPSHLSLEQALEWIARLSPRRALLTHMHIPLDYDAVASETPAHVDPAHDGLMVEFEYPEGEGA